MSIFGNSEDLGENPLQVANRYNFHKRKMYPEYFEPMSPTEEAFEELQERYFTAPNTLAEIYVVEQYAPEKIKYFYQNKILP
jgi:hypothetical protein